MPVSLQAPAIMLLSIILIGASLCCPADRRTSIWNRKNLIVSGLIGLFGPVLLFLSLELCFWANARLGSPASRFTYARWIESAPNVMECCTLIPAPRRWDQAWYWLEAAATEGHPEAMYAMGVRVKRQLWLPKGTQFSEADGQSMIDKSLAAGYRPVVPEVQYSLQKFRFPSFCIL